jgi:anhydro-N-acetylmuramic acid kinase
VDHLLFARTDRSRLVLNVGGIANVTALKAGAPIEEVVAFDTGPGNMVMDALAEVLSGGEKHMDEGGAQARRGTPHVGIVAKALEQPFFAKRPPRAAGREQFGREYAREFHRRCRVEKLSPAATLATAVRLTSGAVAQAYERFIRPEFPAEELIVSGGGAHNVALLEDLARLLPGIDVVTSDYYGLDVDAKEAAAFALLGHWSLSGEPGNLPRVTGARRAVVLGDFTPGAAS